jgi:hypothetical protein
MSFISLIGFILFIVICLGLKQTCLPYLAQKEFTFINKDNQEINVPAQPPDYPKLISTIVIGVLFLMFVMISIIKLWNFGFTDWFLKL